MAQVFDFRTKLKKVQTGTGGKPTKPAFKLPMLSVATEKGKKFQLKCGVTGHPKPQLTWMCKGQKIAESETVKMYNDKQDPEMYILEVLKAEPDHAGEWTVEAANQVGKETMSAKVSIKKQSKPEIVEELTDQKVFKGSNLKLRVKSDGLPTPKAKWSRAGKEITERRGVDFLNNAGEGTYECIIYDVGESNDGEYQVELTNTAGSAVSKCKVTIQEALVKPSFDALKGKRPDWGKEFRLTTRVSGNPKPSVKWQKDGVDIKDGDNGVKITSDELTGKHELLIEDFGPEHVGDYKCVAESEAGTEATNFDAKPEKPAKKPTVDVPLQATKVLRGQTLRLVAKISGEPVPEILWTKNGKPLDVGPDVQSFFNFESGEVELIINNFEDKDVGSYEMNLTSRIGKDSSVAKVDITEPPKTKPNFDIPLSTVYDPAKKLLILKCKVSGYPKPSLVWAGPDGKELQPGPEVQFAEDPSDPEIKILNITNFTEGKEGEYSVTASSPAGTAKRSINISIKQTKQENTNRPQFVIPLKVDFDPLNGLIVLSCRVTGDPKPEVKWLKYNDKLESEGDYELTADEDGNHVLKISNVSSTHHGDYSCMATSNLGMAKQTCTLVLKEKPKVDMVERPVLEKGKPFALGFKVTGGENIKVRWMRNGQQLETGGDVELSQEGDLHRLRIAELNEANAGDYTIEASGEGGTVRSTISLSFSEGGSAERAVVLFKWNVAAIKDVSSQLQTAGFKPAGSKIVKVRVDMLQSQFGKDTALMGKLISMPDAPVFLACWEGTGVNDMLKKKVEEVAANAGSPFAEVVHASANAEQGKKEVGIWFKPYELSAWALPDVSL